MITFLLWVAIALTSISVLLLALHVVVLIDRIGFIGFILLASFQGLVGMLAFAGQYTIIGQQKPAAALVGGAFILSIIQLTVLIKTERKLRTTWQKQSYYSGE